MAGYDLTGAEFYDLINYESPAGLKAAKFSKSGTDLKAVGLGNATDLYEAVAYNHGLAWSLDNIIDFGAIFTIDDVATPANTALTVFGITNMPTDFRMFNLETIHTDVLAAARFEQFSAAGLSTVETGASFTPAEMIGRKITLIGKYVPVLNGTYIWLYFDESNVIQDSFFKAAPYTEVFNSIFCGWINYGGAGTAYSQVSYTLHNIWMVRSDIQPTDGFSSDDYYKKGLQGLLPSGRAWNRDPNSNLSKVLKSITDELAIVDYRATNILDEVDPRGAIELIQEHENDLGLPDELYSIGTSLPDRQASALAKLTAKGGNSKQYFIDLAADVFDMTISISFFTPFWSGMGCSGDPCGDQQNIFYWKVSTYFDVLHEKYRDAMIRVFELLKPAHTVIIWDYYAEYDWSYSTAFDAIPARLTDWLEGAFDKAFSIAFDRRSGGGFSHEAFSWDEFDTEH